MKPPRKFSPVLYALGGLMALALGGHLAYRGLHQELEPPVWQVDGGDPARGKEAAVRHGCNGCHVIPGLPRPDGRVGPSLGGIGQQIYLAGRLPNSPENMVRWIMHPQAVDPQSAMPNLGVSEAEARDIAAYLYSLR